LGYGKACYELFKIYFEGRYNEQKNIDKAMSYLKKGVELEDDVSMVVASKFYQSGEYGFEKNYAKSYECLMKASKKENPLAYYELGLLYLSGYPEYDLDKVIGYFKLAKVNGMTVSKKMLSKSYLQKISEAKYHDSSKKREKKFSEKEILFKIQAKLKKLGYYKSKVDGIYGPGTKRAIIKYQKNKQLTVTGKPSISLLKMLEKE